MLVLSPEVAVEHSTMALEAAAAALTGSIRLAASVGLGAVWIADVMAALAGIGRSRALPVAEW